MRFAGRQASRGIQEIFSPVEIDMEVKYPTRGQAPESTALVLDIDIPDAAARRVDCVAAAIERHGWFGQSLELRPYASPSRTTSPPGRNRRVVAVLALVVAPLVSIRSSAARDCREVVQALSQGQHEVAPQLHAELLAGIPRDRVMLTLRGIASTQIGRTEGALASYRSALQAAPDNWAALQGAAEIEFRQRDPEAHNRLGRATSIHSEDPTVCACSGFLRERDRTARQRSSTSREPGRRWRRTGRCCHGNTDSALREGDVRATIRSFRRLRNLEPSN